MSRTCLHCGEPESRQGERVNLDPISGLCVPCLVARAKALPKAMPQVEHVEEFDWKFAAAGEDE